MKHRGLKFLFLLLTLALLVGLLPGMSLTALAETEQSETIATTAKTVNGNHFTISSSFAHKTYGMIAYEGLGGITVTPKNNEYITKVVITCDWQPGYINNNITVSSGTTTITGGGTTITVTDVNASTFNFKCGSSTPCFNPFVVYYLDSAPVPVTGVTLTPTSATLSVDGVQKLTATVSPADATDKKVKWSIIEGDHDIGLYSDEGCTTPFTLETATDTLTAYVKGITVDKGGTVQVESNADPTKTATCTVKVNAAAYTVTYAPGEGSGSMNPTTVSKNAEGKFMYNVESCGFTAPDGKTFDFWKGSDGKEYRVGGKYELSGDLTLTAQWKDEEKPDDGKKKTGGSGSFDLVFNIPGADNSWEYAPGYAPQQAYRVSLAPMQGGSASLGLTTGESTETAMNVYPSSTVYVFPNAEQGYVLDKIVWSLIDGSASYDITEAKNFVMPAMDAVVYVTFRPVG